MSEEETTTTETANIQTLISELEKRGGYPRAFTLAEFNAYNTAAAEHELDKLTEEVGLQASASTLENRNVRLESVQKGIEALQKQLDDAYAAKTWDTARIDKLVDQLEAQVAKERELLLELAPDRIKQHREQEALYRDLLAAQDRVNTSTIIALAEMHDLQAPTLDDVLNTATGDDLDSIAELVETGIESGSPLNRATRRAAKKKRRALN